MQNLFFDFETTPESPLNSLGITNKYDREFMNVILEVENQYQAMTKQDKLKIESWVKLLCIPTSNQEWKKNRNLHAIVLLDCILNNKLESPYDKFVHESETLPSLDRIIIKTRLSDKFKQLESLNSEENLENYSRYYFINYLLPKRNLKQKKMF